MLRKRIGACLKVAVVVALAGTGLFALPTPASAGAVPCSDARNPVELDWGWYQENSAYVCLINNVPTMVGIYFPNNGVGGGERVWANAFSGCNYDPDWYAYIWSGTNGTGNHDVLLRTSDGEGSCHPFVNGVRNNNYSLTWRSS
jgi:hypothetical protein